MKVRKATSKDAASIHRLIREHSGILLQDHLPRTTEFFVAVDGKRPRIVGCCALVVYSKRLAEIRSLAVSKAFRGKGIATELINACVALADTKKVYEVLSITGAKELFEKNGFGMLKKEKYALIKVLRD